MRAFARALARPSVAAAVAAAVASALLPAGPAAADSFDDLAAKAVPLRTADSVIWPLTATCDRGDELTRRQCRLLRERAAARLRGRTLLVDATGAFEVGAFDAAKKAAPLTLRGCVACSPVTVDGAPWRIVATTPAVAGAAATTPSADPAIIHQTSRVFGNEAGAVAWRTQVVPRLRSQLLVTVPAQPTIVAATGAAGARTLVVEAVGYRVFDPCDGGVVCASPSSSQGAVDKKACGTTIVDGAAAGEVVVDELTRDMILDGLRPRLAVAQACFEEHGQAGSATLKLTIGGDGTIVALEQRGDFVGSPTAACIDAAISQARFPRSRKARTRISYPISLR